MQGCIDVRVAHLNGRFLLGFDVPIQHKVDSGNATNDFKNLLELCLSKIQRDLPFSRNG